MRLNREPRANAVAPSPTISADDLALLDRMRARGHVSWNRLGPLLPVTPIKLGPGVSVSDLLVKMREEAPY